MSLGRVIRVSSAYALMEEQTGSDMSASRREFRDLLSGESPGGLPDAGAFIVPDPGRFSVDQLILAP
jgi:hypothetical protein